MVKSENLFVFIHFSEVNVIAQDSKPRVIVMTDGEIDDHSSMMRFLLYTCDVEVCAIIETNSIFQKEGHSKEDWYEKQLDAYEKVYPNLIKPEWIGVLLINSKMPIISRS